MRERIYPLVLIAFFGVLLLNAHRVDSAPGKPKAEPIPAPPESLAEGWYWAVTSVDEGKSFGSMVLVVRHPEIHNRYAVAWHAGTEVSGTGWGKREGDSFAISWGSNKGDRGHLSMTIAKDGKKLAGRWWTGSADGSEEWTYQRSHKP